MIREAVQSQSWNDYGMLAITALTRKRPGTHYRGYETTVNLYDQTYRAIVVHSSAHDRRWQKRLEREVDREHRTLTKKLAELQKTLYFCNAHAQAAMAKVLKESPQYHEIELTIEESPQDARGRPKADGSRTLKEMRYGICGQLRQKPQAIDTLREQAGCFVLITNVPAQGPPNANTPYDGKKILQTYKDQNGIGHNFSFLKDPVLINAVFLKKPQRIEALGVILVISILLWRLIEFNMRSHLEKNETTLPGWNNIGLAPIVHRYHPSSTSQNNPCFFFRHIRKIYYLRKAKPAVRRGRKATGLLGHGREPGCLKRGRPFLCAETICLEPLSGRGGEPLSTDNAWSFR